MPLRLGYILILSFLYHCAWAQPGDLSNLRARHLPVDSVETRLDTLLVLPSTLLVKDRPGGVPVDTALYRLEGTSLRWAGPPERRPDSVFVSYRVVPWPLQRPLSHLDRSQLRTQEDSSGTPSLAYRPFAATGSLIDFGKLDYNGTFARGLSFGNNQDLVLNSSFNLQLAGDLGEGVEILAAISDENIPIQPQGNTQQLQEFDRIFVQLSKGNNKLIAGDYELRPPDSYFMTYFKKLQGATASNLSQLGRGTLQTEASVAIARGQFTRNVLQQQEGNQGPYKLQGGRNERFIIVLSGTERVYLDGRLLRRGLEEDYIIDYNRGEITFTNKILITKDSRIVVEFEYSDQNYLRSMYAANTQYRQEGLRVYFNFLNQQDSRNSTGSMELSNADKAVLADAGDDPLKAVVPGLDPLEEFNPARSMYEYVDTLLPCGQRDSLLRYTTDPARARYTARFTFVGAGNGNYALDDAQTSNERVYRWVDPDPVTCAPRGAYAPIIQLATPIKQLMMTAGMEIDLSPTAALRTEVSLSQEDLNRFSSLDNGDNVGMALFTEGEKAFRLGNAEKGGWQLRTDASYEFVQRNFRPLNPYRSPEFLRDWSLAGKQGQTAPLERVDEHIVRAGLSFQNEQGNALAYRFGTFLRDTLYSGFRQEASLRFQQGGFSARGQASWLNSASSDLNSRFFRPRAEVSQVLPWLGNWQVGGTFEMDRNARNLAAADTLDPSSYYYDLTRVFLRSPDEQKLQLETSASRRQDYEPDGEAFVRNSVADEINLNGRWQAGRSLQLRGNFTYRNLQILKPELSAQEPAETFLGRSDVLWNGFRGAIRSTTTYEIGSGQEPKLEFTFVEVRKGEGTHIWLDSLFNNDGVIQPEEMVIAPFPDQADFVRVTTFTDEYIRTNYVNLNQSLQLNPKAVWFNEEGLKGFLARFSTQSSFKINRKTQPNADISPWNPFQLDVADTSLVSLGANIRNVLFFNRADPVYDLQLGALDNSSKRVQTAGFISLRLKEQYLRGRWNITRALSTQLGFARGERFSDAEFTETRDYRIEYFNVEPKLTFLPVRQFRAILTYLFQKDEDMLTDDGARSRRHDFKLEATYNRSARSSFRAAFSWVNIDFEGQASSPVGFAILNGLQPGKNLLWNLSFDQQLGRNLQLRLSYEGRKTGAADVVHVGRAQVAATF